jgi:hypothetical protein
MFCSRCGTALEASSSFCTQCGSPVEGKPHPQQTGVFGVLPQVVEVKGFLGQATRFMNLVVTNRSLILAHQLDAMEDAMDCLTEPLDQALAASGEQWRQLADSYSFSARPWDCYQNMDVEAILREHPENVEIPVAELRSVRLELSEDPESHSDTLYLETGAQTLDLDLPWGNGHLARELLSRVVPVQME